MSNPKITVIINTLNEKPAWLRSAVKSYQAQTGVDVQIIISCVKGDRNLPLIKQMGCEVVVNDAPGIYQQINKALPLIKGEYVAYASSNDIAEPFKLRSEYDQCVKFNKMVCYSSFHKCSVDLRPIALRQARPYNYNEHLKGNYVNDCALVHASLIEKYAPFRTEWKNHAFYDLWLRIYEGEGDVFINNPTPTWFYRAHDGLKTQRQHNNTLLKINRESRERMLKWHREYAPFNPGIFGIVQQPATCSDGNLTLDVFHKWVDDILPDIPDNFTAIKGIDGDINYVKPITESTETHFVYVYVASPAKWNELAISIQSIRKHFQGKAKFFCVGDSPGVKDVIHIPVVQIKGRGSKPKDAVAKLKAIIDCQMINEDFIYCYDDVILLKPITPAWFDRIIANDYVKDYTTHWKGARGILPDHGWLTLFMRTFAVLTKRGLPTFNFETHIPRKLNKTKIQQTLARFGENCNETLFNSLYFNYHHKPDLLLREVPRIKAGLHRAFDNPEKLLAEIKGRTWLSYSDPFLNELAKRTINKILKGEIKP